MLQGPNRSIFDESCLVAPGYILKYLSHQNKNLREILPADLLHIVINKLGIPFRILKDCFCFGFSKG